MDIIDGNFDEVAEALIQADAEEAIDD